MAERNRDIECELTAALSARCNSYQSSYAKLAALEERLHAGDSLQHVCPELQKVLCAIRTADERLAPLQEDWRQLSRAPGTELAAEIERHRAQLERTLALIDRLAKSASADRALLAPRLDEAARGRRMQAAYAATGRY